MCITGPLVEPRIPISDAAHHLESEGDVEHSALDRALYDGEDFELLFTIPTKNVDQLLAEWPGQFHLPLKSIGAITAETGKLILVDERGEEESLLPRGYDHFRKRQG